MRNPPKLILCVDQAAKSGWCIVQLAEPSVRIERILDWGTATTFAARRTVMAQLLEHQRQRDIKPANMWLVLEDHSKSSWGKFGAATMVGAGKAYGRWEEQWLFHGFVHSHIEPVAAATWRAHVLGSAKGGDAARAVAVECARRVCGEVDSVDAAESVCIGLWAAANLERVLRGEPAPKKPRAKRRKAAA